MINWTEEVEKREENLIQATQQLLQLKSVLDEESVRDGAPFGTEIYEAYNWFLQLAKKDGFTVKDVDGYAGHIEWGEGEELLGILCHLDVVPEGEGWTSPPFAAEIRNGNIYARGAIDDKGPTMAAYFALKIVKELGVPLKKRVRIIVGNDEESQWRCVDHYFQREEMPTIGFAPDADFPIIYAEKGICDISYTLESKEINGNVTEFSSGERLNMVPEKAYARLNNVKFEDVEGLFNEFLQNSQLRGTIQQANGTVTIEVYGKSAHGMEPDKGVNSGIWLAKFLLDKVTTGIEEKKFFSIIVDNFLGDSRGRKLGIAYEDKEKGPVTINIGTMKYSSASGGKVGINLRYPEGANFDNIHDAFHRLFTNVGFQETIITHITPHMVEKDHPLIQTLSKVYEEQTREKATPIAIGGGTYARSLDAGVAFGPMFPGQEDVAHEADEYISIEHLKKATAIYAQAIYELTK